MILTHDNMICHVLQEFESITFALAVAVQAMTRVANNAEHGLWDPTDEVQHVVMLVYVAVVHP